MDGEVLEFQLDNLALIMENAKGRATKELWEDLLKNDLIQEDISEFLKLAQIMLVIPIGSVANERAFSLMNILKSDLRNRLKSEHLNCAMRAKRSEYTLSSLPVQRIVDVFLKKKTRRMLKRKVPAQA